MSIITGDGTTYPASFEGPDDGDERDAASHLVAMEALADRTEFLKDRVVDGDQPINTAGITVAGDATVNGQMNVGGNAIVGNNLTVTADATIGDDLTVTDDLTVGGLIDANGDVEVAGAVTVDGYVSSAGGYFVPAPESVTRVVDSPGETSDGWEILVTTYDFYWVTTTVFQRKLRICLNAIIPRGASITQLVARFAAGPGHSALPANKAQLILYRKRVGTSGAASGTVDSTPDPSTDPSAYEAEHDITLTLGTPHTATTDTHSYYAVIVSESDGGGNAFSGAVLFGLKITYTYTRVDPI